MSRTPEIRTPSDSPPLSPPHARGQKCGSVDAGFLRCAGGTAELLPIKFAHDIRTIGVKRPKD